jgi:hypothetical protein
VDCKTKVVSTEEIGPGITFFVSLSLFGKLFHKRGKQRRIKLASNQAEIRTGYFLTRGPEHRQCTSLFDNFDSLELLTTV